MPVLGVRKAAQLLGVSHPALIKARDRGALQFEPDGKVDTDKVLQSEWWQKHEADRGGEGKAPPAARPPAGVPPGVVVRRAEELTPLQERGVRVEPEPQPHGGWLKRERMADGDEEDQVGPDGKKPVAKIELDKDLVRERTEKLRLENEVSRGKLVDREAMETATESRIRADAEALLNWPGRISAEMAAELGIEDRVMHNALDKYVRRFMSERAKAKAAVSDPPVAA